MSIDQTALGPLLATLTQAKTAVKPSVGGPAKPLQTPLTDQAAELDVVAQFAAALLAESLPAGEALPLPGNLLPVPTGEGETDPAALVATLLADEGDLPTGWQVIRAGAGESDLPLRVVPALPVGEPVVELTAAEAASILSDPVALDSVAAESAAGTGALLTASALSRATLAPAAVPASATNPQPAASAPAAALAPQRSLSPGKPAPTLPLDAIDVTGPDVALPDSVAPEADGLPLKRPLTGPSADAATGSRTSAPPTPAAPIDLAPVAAATASQARDALVEQWRELRNATGRAGIAVPSAVTPAAAPPGGLASPTSPATAPVLDIPAPLPLPASEQPGEWSRQFSERVGWVIHARVPSAQLRLHPEHLGPVELAVEVDDHLARVQFTAAHPLTRDAIEQSLPRLRELLEQQGLVLEHADVGDLAGQARDQAQDREAEAQAAVFQLDPQGEESTILSPASAPPRGLIDTYV